MIVIKFLCVALRSSHGPRSAFTIREVGVEKIFLGGFAGGSPQEILKITSPESAFPAISHNNFV